MLLELKNVSKQFVNGTVVKNAVKNVSLSVENGEFISITGKSGSGKSTLINLIAGILSLTEGKITFDGKDLSTLSDDEKSVLRNQRIGYISQGQTLLSSLNVFDNVRLPAFIWRNSDAVLQKSDEVAEYALLLLRRLGIDSLCEQFPSSLSGGELHRVLIARSLINNPVLLLADEPTGDLDGENTQEIMRILTEISGKGMAVVLVTHDEETTKYASRHYSMTDGELFFK